MSTDAGHFMDMGVVGDPACSTVGFVFGHSRYCLTIVGTASENVGGLVLRAGPGEAPVRPVPATGCFVGLLALADQPRDAELVFHDGDDVARRRRVALGPDR